MVERNMEGLLDSPEVRVLVKAAKLTTEEEKKVLEC